MNFTSKFNIGDMVQFVEETKTLAKIIEIKITPASKVAYNVQLNDANHTFLVDIHESRLEKAENPPFIFAGHKVTQGNDKSKVQIGCKTVTKSDVENLIDLADKFKIFDFSTDISKYEIRIEQVRELYAKFFQNNNQQKSLKIFLAKNGMLEKFKSNMQANKEYNSIEELEARVSEGLLIESAFSWVRSREGFGVWSKINSQWKNYIKE